MRTELRVTVLQKRDFFEEGELSVQKQNNHTTSTSVKSNIGTCSLLSCFGNGKGNGRGKVYNIKPGERGFLQYLPGWDGWWWSLWFYTPCLSPLPWGGYHPLFNQYSGPPLGFLSLPCHLLTRKTDRAAPSLFFFLRFLLLKHPRLLLFFPLILFLLFNLFTNLSQAHVNLLRPFGFVLQEFFFSTFFLCFSLL